MINNDIKEIIMTQTEIENVCLNLGSKITADYTNKSLLVVGLLKGCVFFLTDLTRHINLKFDIGFMSVSSYLGNTKSSGEVNIKMDLDIPLRNRDVLIVEDIIDTGTTIQTITNLLKHRGANSVEVVTLLDKMDSRIHPFIPKYIGKVIPNKFVVGYGLDYNEHYRNLPYIGVLKESIYLKEEN